MDSRRLIRGVVLQALYELDLTLRSPSDVLYFYDGPPLVYDVRILGYLAFRARQNTANWPKEPERPFTLYLNTPLDQRQPVEQILLDYLTEGYFLDDQPEDAQADLVQLLLVPELEEFDLRFATPAEALSLDDQKHVQNLVTEIWERRRNLDKTIHDYAPEWPVSQMAVIDRNILRMAIYEFAITKETPIKVAINEAVELAKVFGSENAPRFVNGVLGSVAEHSEEIHAESQAS